MENEKESKKHILLNIFIVLVILVLGLYLYARYIEPSKLEVKEYKISNEIIPLNFSGLKIVHISDIYYGNTTHEENIKKLVEKINILKPDLVIFTGNLFGNNIKDKDILIKNFKNIDTNLGKYAVKGNNDYNESFDSVMKESGFIVLNNSYELIYNEGLTPIYICGLSSSLKEKTSFEECKLETENNYYKILLTHEGDVTSEVLKSDLSINLILSGNSLNGTIVVPYYGPLFIPKGSKEYFGEYYKRDSTDIYISSGIGTNEYPYRLFNAPSFNLYRLKSLQ